MTKVETVHLLEIMTSPLLELWTPPIPTLSISSDSSIRFLQFFNDTVIRFDYVKPDNLSHWTVLEMSCIIHQIIELK